MPWDKGTVLLSHTIKEKWDRRTVPLSHNGEYPHNETHLLISSVLTMY